MAVDRIGVDADADAEQERADRRPPPDQPGTEGIPSRAESRHGALTANEKSASAETAAPEPDVEDSEREEISGPYAERLDVPIGDDQPTPREVLKRFAPAEANLPEITEEEAAEYIDQKADQRPWLASAKVCDPCVQRVLAAMDQGQGHALQRHEGYADDERLRRRVTSLEDPAQTDDDKRVAGIDGCKPGDRRHRCADTATAIQDPADFATAFARGVEHPRVRAVLESKFDPDVNPPRVSIPINELIGSGGHERCRGYRLMPVGGEIRLAKDHRIAWVQAMVDGRDPSVPPPGATPIDSFKGGTVEFFFRPTSDRKSHELGTMYVEPIRKE